MRSWKVLDPDFEATGVRIPLDCPGCGTEAAMPTHGTGPKVIAAIGLSLILDPPSTTAPAGWLPRAVQCRRCRRQFEAIDEPHNESFHDKQGAEANVR